MRCIAVMALFAAVMARTACAQVEISPTRVILTLRERAQEVVLTNPTADRVEVSTDLGFKLFQSDSAGRITLREDGSPEELARSCKNWVKIFPHKFTLAPGESRSARILILPPDSIPDGEYWARALFSSLPLDNPMDDAGDSATSISTQLRMRVVLDIPIIFRKGAMQTGIDVEHVRLQNNGGGTRVLIDLKRLGNAAYRGTLSAVLRSADGSVLKRVEEQFTTEFTLRKSFPLPNMQPGNYSIDVESIAVKKGGANDAVIPAPAVRKVYDVIVSAGGFTVSIRE